MNKGQYTTSLNKASSLLRKHSLLKGTPVRFRGSSTKSPEVSDKYDYVEEYKEAIDIFNYDFLLFDESILQFSYPTDMRHNPLIRYAYYQCPYEYLSYEQYLFNIGFSYEEAGEVFQTEYEQLLSEASLEAHYMYIRYDYSVDEYTLAVHPASHLHIGHLGSIRIPIQMIITPYMFVLFVLKQCYYSEWKHLIKDHKFRTAFQASKTSCSLLDSRLFSDLDKKELYLV